MAEKRPHSDEQEHSPASNRSENAPRKSGQPSRKNAKFNKMNQSKKGTSEVWFAGVPKALIQASKENEDSCPGLVKTKSFSGPTRVIAIDCEFVGVGFGGKENALARASVVNQFGHVLLDEFVRPREPITDYRTAVSGISPHHMRRGGPAKDFASVTDAIAKLCSGRILVGHAVHNDLKICTLGAEPSAFECRRRSSVCYWRPTNWPIPEVPNNGVNRLNLLQVLMLSHPKRDIRDTSRYRPFKEMFNGRNPSLKALTEQLIGVGVQKGEHDSVEDARATMRIYTTVKRIWEAQLKARRAGKPAVEIRRLADHLRLPRGGDACANTGESSNNRGLLKPTQLAKISLDVASEFAAGLPPRSTTNGVATQDHIKKGRNSLAFPTGDHRDRSGGRKCSKRRERFIEKRIRTRKKKSFNSSAMATDLFC